MTQKPENVGPVDEKDRQDAQPRGVVPESEEWVKGGGPTFTQGGVMPGGPEMEGWKKPAKGDPDAITPASNPVRPMGTPDDSEPATPTGSTEATPAETEHKQRG